MSYIKLIIEFWTETLFNIIYIIENFKLNIFLVYVVNKIYIIYYFVFFEVFIAVSENSANKMACDTDFTFPPSF